MLTDEWGVMVDHDGRRPATCRFYLFLFIFIINSFRLSSSEYARVLSKRRMAGKEDHSKKSQQRRLFFFFCPFYFLLSLVSPAKVFKIQRRNPSPRHLVPVLADDFATKNKIPDGPARAAFIFFFSSERNP